MLRAKRPLKVFLCHAHSDAAAVGVLYSQLRGEGVDAWLDKEKLIPGSDWEMEIENAVRDADVVVVCLSKQFNEAGFRQKEVRLALRTALEQPEGEIYIVPARLEECDVPPSLRRIHWVDLFKEDGYEKLSLALRARAKRVDANFSSRPSERGLPSAKAKPVSKLGRLTNKTVLVILALIVSILAIVVFGADKQNLAVFFPRQTATPTFTLTSQPTALSETTEPTRTAAPGLGGPSIWIPCDAAEITKGSGESRVTLLPGQIFVPVWRVRNVGSCTWSGYSLVFYGGDELDTASSVEIDKAVAPGQEVDLMVRLKAPLAPGTYRGYWRIRNAFAVLIDIENGYEGKSLSVKIEVARPPDTP